MKRAPSGALVVVGLVGVALVLSIILATRTSGGVQSIVLVTIDTFRADRAGFNGGTGGLTPHLDALAAEGAVFEDATAAAPLTLPSHATILTGLLPPRHGLRDNDSPRPLPAGDLRNFNTGAEILGGSGYATAAFVSASPLAARWGLDAGFQTYDAPPERDPGALLLGERVGSETMDRALGWLRNRNKRRAFFLWVHLFDPHAPYRAPGGAGLPPDSAGAYDEEVKYADAQVGRLLDELRTEGILGRTVVAVTSDHGEGLGEHGESTHGYFLHRSTLRVPLVVRAPGIPAGSRVKVPVSLADLLPTLLEAAGRPLTEKLLDGRSRMPLLRGEPGASDPSSQYAESVYGWRVFRWSQAVSLRDGPIRVVDHGGDRREVYDLAADPGETKDLGPAAPASAAEAGAAAWATFGSPSLWRGAAATGTAPDPALVTIPYVSSYSPVKIGDPAGNGKLPLPTTAFLRQFETALVLLDRTRADKPAEEAEAEMDEAVTILEALAKEQPDNPAPHFWLGRAHRQRAHAAGSGGTGNWLKAFLEFQTAGRLGYQEPRTVEMMMEAAFQSQKLAEGLQVARAAVEIAKMDGDAGFWGWIAISEGMGQLDSAGRPTTEARARALDAIEKAEARCRSEAEKRRIAEIRELFK